jgi:hypothetical protein
MNGTAEKYADEINKLLPNIKVGTLRFFGVWFGRPYDNWHQAVKAGAKEDVLQVTFGEGEILEILAPTSCTFSSSQFEIRHARKVLWKWYSYGSPQTEENLFYYEFEVHGDQVQMTTNVTWYKEEQAPQITELAVKIY